MLRQAAAGQRISGRRPPQIAVEPGNQKKAQEIQRSTVPEKEGSRQTLFLEDEKPLLLPLPATRFESAEHRTATVQFNYHIAVDKMYYSVPYQYIKDKVDVRMTDTTIEIFKIIDGLLRINVCMDVLVSILL